MNNLIYYVAMSVDGYIATDTGGVEWLETLPPVEDGYGYPAFYETVDSLVMGRGTYDQILTFGEWPYAGKLTWVLTSQPLSPIHPDVIISHDSPQGVMRQIQAAGHRTTWLVGGGQLARSFLDAGLLNELYITVTPDLLGTGIPLLASGGSLTSLDLLDSRVYETGVIALRYRVKEQGDR